MIRYSWRHVALCSSALCVFAPTAILAQEQQVETVVVTAQKRPEDVQKTPVAVTPISGLQLQQESIREPQDLGRLVPSLTMAPTPSTSTGIFTDIRGQVASDVILNINQAVGLYLDGVDIPHPEGTNGSLFDLSRIEVLRGPQGTLYGRNTTGGNVNVFSKGADFNGYHGFAEAEGGNYDDWKLGGAVNIPLIDNELAVRLAYQHWNREGFGQDVLTGERLGGDHDDNIGRVSVLFTPRSDLTVDVRAEYVSLHRNGDLITERGLDPNLELAGPPTGALEAGLESNPLLVGDLLTNNVGPIIGAGNAVILKSLGGVVGAPSALPPFLPAGAPYGLTFEAPGGPVGPLGNFVNNNLFTTDTTTQDFEHYHGWHVSSNIAWDITSDVQLKSITGYHQFVDHHVVDLNASPWQGEIIGAGLGQAQPVIGSANFPALPEEQDRFFSQEFDLSGNAYNNRVHWLFGAYYSDDDGNGAQPSILTPTVLAYASLACFAGPICVSGAPPNLVYTPNGAYQPEFVFAYDQKKVLDDSYAFFSQEDFKITDALTLTAGGRYTVDRLKQDISTWAFDASPFDAAHPFMGVVSDPLAGLYVCPLDSPSSPASASNSVCDVVQTAKFTGLSYLVSLNYQITDDMMAYVKTSQGYRGGALQARAAFFPAAKPEIAHDFEAGLKSLFFDHRLELDGAIYETLYSNKQVTQVIPANGVIPIPSTPIFNAASEHIKGFELEGTAIPIDSLTLHGTLSYTDAIYNRFGSPACNGVLDPSPALGCDLTPGNVGFNGTGYNAGEPKWHYSITARYDTPVLDNNLGIEADWAWKSAIPITPATADVTFPILQKQFNEAVGILNARVDYTLAGDGWEGGWNIAFFSTNLLNKHYQIASLDANAFGYGIPTGITQEPRMWGIQIRKSFGGE